MLNLSTVCDVGRDDNNEARQVLGTHVNRRCRVPPSSPHGIPRKPPRAPKSITLCSPRYRTRPVSPRRDPVALSHAMMMASPANSGRFSRRDSQSCHPSAGCEKAPRCACWGGVLKAVALPTTPHCSTLSTKRCATSWSSVRLIAEIPAFSKHLIGCGSHGRRTRRPRTPCRR